MSGGHDHSDMAGLEAFRAFRSEMNERLVDSGHLGIKRFLGLVVGGSIVIPHLRRALRALDALLAERAASREGPREV